MTMGRDSMYPIELAIDFDLSRSQWFQWIFSDPAYLFCVLYGASATRDFLHNRYRFSRLTHSHHTSAITHLAGNLSDRNLAIRDSTVAVIITLLMTASILGEESTAMAHVAGLKAIVKERGGLCAFQHNPKLHIKIGR